MKVSVVLADKATNNPQAGTLNILNAGWVQTQLVPHPLAPQGQLITAPHIVAVFFEVEHSLCNAPIELVLELLTEDGQPVLVPQPTGPQPVRVVSVVTVPSPAMAPIAAPGTGNAMIEIFPGLPIPPGGYRWNVTLAGEHHEEWYAAFRVVPAPQMPQITFGGVVPPPPPSPEEPGEAG
jgi:hypothetical protein